MPNLRSRSSHARARIEGIADGSDERIEIASCRETAGAGFGSASAVMVLQCNTWVSKGKNVTCGPATQVKKWLER